MTWGCWYAAKSYTMWLSLLVAFVLAQPLTACRTCWALISVLCPASSIPSKVKSRRWRLTSR